VSGSCGLLPELAINATVGLDSYTVPLVIREDMKIVVSAVNVECFAEA